MSKAESPGLSVDINVMLEEYESQIRNLMTEMIRYKAIAKQLQIDHAKEIKALKEGMVAQHKAPPPPPAIAEEILEA
ncbi:hypothetical protein ABFV99_13080 [Cytobacillus horneckiae]|uniref:hypothetical protein n=1 Tax=Cytobacillus horneckiae TaxID=549687 RepID=UPI0034CF1193